MSGRDSRTADSRTRRWLHVRRALVGAVLLLAGLVTVLGVHPSSVDRLRADVSAGAVTSVQASAVQETPTDGVAASTTSPTSPTSEVRWRTGVVTRSADVVPDDTVAELRAVDPGLEVERLPTPTDAWLLHDVDVPGWTLLAAAGVWTAALVTLVHGPEPWRLTRWGWAWSLLLVPPVGVVLFALFSGPAPPLPRSRRGRRFGGLAGLLLALVLGAVVPG